MDIEPLRRLSGVEIADTGTLAGTVADHHLVLQVRGEMGPLLHALDRLPVVTVDSREPSLEEIFLVHYRDQAARRDVAAGQER